jgi:hypothetical protein
MRFVRIAVVDDMDAFVLIDLEGVGAVGVNLSGLCCRPCRFGSDGICRSAGAYTGAKPILTERRSPPSQTQEEKRIRRQGSKRLIARILVIDHNNNKYVAHIIEEIKSFLRIARVQGKRPYQRALYRLPGIIGWHVV